MVSKLGGMKRDLKFRFVLRNKSLDRIEFKWYTLNQLEQNSLKELFNVEDYEIISRDQFTGLKDCNGVDIYEGDYDQDHQVVVWCERRLGWSLFTYDFPTKEFIHCNCYNCEGNYELNECFDIDIIGNIHQNPELQP